MKAMVLCAGCGTRLGELTRELPKPMLPLLDRPLLAYLLGHLRSGGICDVAINLHHRPDVIPRWFSDGSRWGMRLNYSLEGSLLGTAGGLKNVANFFCDEEAFIVQHGDVITDQDLGILTRFHRENQAIVTLLVHRRRGSNSVVSLDAVNRVTSFVERPDARMDRGLTWANSGLFVCSPSIFDYIPDTRPADLPRDVFSKIVDTGRMFAVPLSGYRCAIDSPARLQEARVAVADGRCRVRPLDVSIAG